MLRIRKDGNVKGGSIWFEYNPDSELLRYKGNVKVGVGPLVKKFEFDDDYKVDRDQMKSGNKYPGQEIVAGECRIKVISLYPDKGWGTADFQADDFEGIANIDISKEYIDIIMVNGKVDFMGLSLKVNAVRE